MFDSLKIQNVSNFYFEKRNAKKIHIFHVFERSLFVMGGPVEMNVDVF